MIGEAKRETSESELKCAARRHFAQGSGRALWRPCPALRRTAAGGGLEDKPLNRRHRCLSPTRTV